MITLRRDTDDAWLGGVLAGIANVIHVEAWVLRLVFTVAMLYVCRSTIAVLFVSFLVLNPFAVIVSLFLGWHWVFTVPYILLWIFVPEAD